MSLPILNDSQIEDLLISANGNAVSFIDSPEWYFGDRKSTVAMRDGMEYVTATKIPTSGLAHGSMNSLAYSCAEKCREYLDCLYWIERKTRDKAEYEILYQRTKSARRKSDIARDIRICDQDIRNSRERLEKIKASYFRGFEGRFLIHLGSPSA